jgi:hypothetical protein
MKLFNDLILAHKGKRICVMGGADSLASHMEGLQADVVISVNAHGVDIRKPDYMLAMDEHYWGTTAPLWQYLRSRSDAPIINPEEWADYRLVTWPGHPKRFVLSGMVAAWAAWAMGAKAVILAGMDGYGGAPSKLAHSSLAAEEIRCPVRVVGGGALTKFWPEYNDRERFGRYTPHSAINGLLGIDGLITIRATKPRFMCGKEREKGEVFQAMRHDAAFWIRHKLAVEL